MNILILHGIMGHAGVNWQQWIHDELVDKKQTVLMPELPNSNHPNRQKWLNTIQELMKDVSLKETIIVAHSLGVTTALDFLEQTDQKLKALVSVSGFGSDYGSELNSYFMKEKDIDYDSVKRHVQDKFVLFGNDDPYVSQEALPDLAIKLEVEPVIIPHGGHLNTEIGYTTFLYLLELIQKIEQ